MEFNTLLSLRKIYKKYASTNIEACKYVDLDINKGEVFALIGDNGAGKTTLVKIIAGFENFDSGEMIYNYEQNSIGMVHQHDKLFFNMTVLDNIILGNEPRKFKIFLDIKKAKIKIISLIKNYGFDLDVKTKIKYLNTKQIKEVGILKALYKNAKLIILDEPTASMSFQDASIIYDTISTFQKNGITIIIITHKIKEVMRIANRIGIMRNGIIENIYQTSAVDYRYISNILLCDDDCKIDDSSIYKKEIPVIAEKKTILELVNISNIKNIYGTTSLDNISFALNSGDILAITASEGNGLRELEDILAGFTLPTSGIIYYHGEDITKYSTIHLRKNNLSYVPANRMHRGVSLHSSILDNAIILKRRLLTKFIFFVRKVTRMHSKNILDTMNIKANYSQNVDTLSGGNIQRLIVAREIERISDYIIFSEPTQGVDIKTCNLIYENIFELKKKGIGIILISSNINEVLILADKIMVLYRGRVFKNLINKDVSEKQLSNYTAGMDEYES